MRLALLTCLLVLGLAPSAFGHAILTESSPERGAVLDASPDEVSFTFSEAVEGAFGAVRVFDSESRRVDTGGVLRPAGASSIGVKLKSGLPDGTYVATYQIVSADSHPVSGGVVFSVGEASSTGGAPAVADLVGTGVGPVTDTAFGIARGITYAATALLVGGLIFLLVVWRTAVLGPATARARRIAVGAAVAGVVAGLAGLVLQGATASGETFWSALDPDTIQSVLDTRFGRAWGLRVLVFAALAAIAWLALRGRPLPQARVIAVAFGLGAAVLCVAPSLAGHASASEPAAALVPLDVLHVLAMSAWIGGLAVLLLVVPLATRALEPAERTRLLARLLLRFSPLALACVLVLIATGTAQSLLHIDRWGALLDTPFGRAVLIKIGLLAVLVGFGAWQRQKVVPRLRALADAGESPGRAGLTLRNVLRAEVALTIVVLGVTSALVAYPPSDSVAAGPYSASKAFGPNTLEVTLEPAAVGSNELHVYLLDKQTGAPFDGTKELTVTASLPDQEIGPLETQPRKAGPGHYVVQGLNLVPAGAWELEIASRTSEFDEDRTKLSVEIR